MTTWLKQSTAADVEIGPMVESDDGFTIITGASLVQADCQLIKNGGAAAQKNDANAASHLGSGHYKVPLNTTDTNTLGRLRLAINESGALPVWRDFMVVPAAIYDSLVAGSDTLPADVTQWNGTNVATPDTAGYPKITIKSGTGTGELSLSGGKALLQDGSITAGVVATGAIDADAIADNAIDAGAIATGAITSAKFASGAIDAAALAADAVDEILDEVVEGSMTLRQLLRILLASAANKSAGGGTTTITFRDQADTKNRISATIDANRNRTAVTLDGS